ncbi:MAG: hypothetical protein J6P44_02375 [Bacteroidales bacterium]|nr:hypothetical protein [Bacteroidales bacterium]
MESLADALFYEEKYIKELELQIRKLTQQKRFLLSELISQYKKHYPTEDVNAMRQALCKNIQNISKNHQPQISLFK